MASHALGVKFTATSTGTVDFVYASAVTGYVGPAASSPAMIDGKTYRYRAENAALSEWEFGSGIYTAASQTIARTNIVLSSTGSKVSFTSAPVVGVVPFPQDLTPVNGYLFGLTLSAAGATATFGIAVGAAGDSLGLDIMALGSAFTKTTSAWALGTAAGSLDTGAIANSTWYHVHLIKRPDTGVVDVLISLSATAPTMPTNYTLFRRIGSMKTNGSAQWTKFSQLGDEFLWDAFVLDITSTNPGTAAVTRTISVPTGIQVLAIVNAQSDTNGITDGRVSVTSLDKADETEYNAGFFNGPGTGQYIIPQRMMIRTNTSAQIRTRNAASGVNSIQYIITAGWIDRRGRDA